MRIKVKLPEGCAVNADRLAQAIRQSLLTEEDPEKIWRLNDVPALAQLEEGVYAAGAQDVAAAYEQTARVLGLPADSAWLDKALKRKKPAAGQLALDFEQDHPRLPAGETKEGYKPGEFVPKEEVPPPAPEPEPEPEEDLEPVPPPRGFLLTKEEFDFLRRRSAWDDKHMTPKLLEQRAAEYEDARRPGREELQERLRGESDFKREDELARELTAYVNETNRTVKEFIERAQSWQHRQTHRDRELLGIGGLVNMIKLAQENGKDIRDLERRLNRVYIAEENDPDSELNKKNRALREAREEKARKLAAIKRYQTPQQLYDKAVKMVMDARKKANVFVRRLDEFRSPPLSPEEYAKKLAEYTAPVDRAIAKAKALRDKADAISDDILQWRRNWGFNSGDGLDGYSGVWDPAWSGYQPPVWEAGRRIDATEAERLKLPEGTTIYTPEEDRQSHIFHDLGPGFAYIGPDDETLMEAARKMEEKVVRCVPAAMYRRLMDKGVRNIFTAAPPYRHGSQRPNQESYFREWLANSKRTKTQIERGFYRNDDLVTGVYFGNSKMTLTRVGAGVPGGKLGSGSLCTMLHEYGHAVDYNWTDEPGNLSDEPEFQEIWEACKPYLKAYYFHSAKELFAEGFDHYAESEMNRNRLREGPPGYQALAGYFDRLFAEAAALDPAPVSKALVLWLPTRVAKSLESGPALPSEEDVPAEWPFWTGIDPHPDGGDICWEGPVLPGYYEELLEDSQPSADMVSEEE